jgi:hypothetical protein
MRRGIHRNAREEWHNCTGEWHNGEYAEFVRPFPSRIRVERHPMAQKVQVVLVDDLDGGSADETVTFSLDGVSYEIDLSHDNAARLRDLMAPYVGHARRASGPSRRAPRSRSASTSAGTSPAEVREWARAQGIDVNERGRISAELRAKYEAAHA